MLRPQSLTACGQLIGSTNMDWRSFLHNDEAAGVVISDQFGQEMQRIFQCDLADSVPIDLA